MRDGVMRGLFCMGQNPAVGGQNARLARRALGSLDWLVVRDVYRDRDAPSFWYDAPEVHGGEVRPQDIGTEIFLLPAGAHAGEGRLVHQHAAAGAVARQGRRAARRLPLGGVVHLPSRPAAEGAVRRTTTARRGRQLQALTWDYRRGGATGEPDLEAVVARDQRLHRRRRPAGAALQRRCKDDGSTASGCWIYSGIMPAEGQNRARDRAGRRPGARSAGASPGRQRAHPLQPRLRRPARAGPGASARRGSGGTPTQGSWTGHDVPDFPRDQAARLPAAAGRQGARRPPRRRRRSCAWPTARGALFAGDRLKDGPLPTHYEPWESPVDNALYPRAAAQPGGAAVRARRQPLPRGRRPALPLRAHDLPPDRAPHGRRHEPLGALAGRATAGGLRGDQPRAGGSARRRQRRLGRASPRCAARSRRARWSPSASSRCTIDGRTVHQIGMPWHFGYGGIAAGAIANDLTPLIEDPNSRIHEAKAFTCNLRQVSKYRVAGPPERRGGTSALYAAERATAVRSAATPITDSRHSARQQLGTAPHHGLPDRHDALHRLQGVRGRLQAVEPAADGQPRPHRLQLRQHRRPRRAPPGGTSPSSSSSPTGRAGGRRACGRSRATG